MSTVMIVDDSQAQRAIIVEILKKNGLEVIEAADGMEAKEKIQRLCPDLVILDIVMPHMNGYELCRWLKNDSNAKHVPVIMCSTKGEDFDLHWGKKQGADDYVTKPFEPKEMIAKVRKLLQQQS